MNGKKRTVPIRIKQNQALLRRTSSNHFKRREIEDDLVKRIAGFRGEESLDYYLKFLPRNKFLTLHDVRLSIENSFFQIDTLILSEKVFFIIEVKNIAGTLTFDTIFNQFIRTLDGREERFPNPLAQVERQQLQLKKWLINRNIISPTFPLVNIVVNSNPQSIIKPTQENAFISEKIVHIEYIVEKIMNIEKQYTKKIFDWSQLLKIGNSIIEQHRPLQQNILKHFQLTAADVLTGVQCPECFSFEMERKRARWECCSCGSISQKASKQAVLDYLLLIAPTINNRQCREFLRISSKEAYRLLKSMNLSESGSFRNKTYFLPDDMHFYY